MPTAQANGITIEYDTFGSPDDRALLLVMGFTAQMTAWREDFCKLLADRGLEFGETAGLGWIGGEVRRMEPHGAGLKIPHMGWNALEAVTGHPLFANLPDGAHMYFTHSFALHPADAADAAAKVDHGGRFTAAVARDNIAGVQFHPEKSQAAGLRLLLVLREYRCAEAECGGDGCRGKPQAMARNRRSAWSRDEFASPLCRWSFLRRTWRMFWAER